MPHIHVVQAQTVLANPANYPEIIVANAQRIVQWSDAKRVAIQWLWNHRDVLRAWQRARVGKSHMEKSRNATRAVMLSGALSREKMNDFHKAHGYLRSASKMALEMAILDALLKALICEDLDLMHQYFACCNARRHASNLEPVGFLRWIGGREANEVLLWRMLNAASKH